MRNSVAEFFHILYLGKFRIPQFSWTVRFVILLGLCDVKQTIVLFCLKIGLIIAINQLWITQTQSLLVDIFYCEKVQRKLLITKLNCVLIACQVIRHQMHCSLKWKCDMVNTPLADVSVSLSFIISCGSVEQSDLITGSIALKPLLESVSGQKSIQTKCQMKVSHCLAQTAFVGGILKWLSEVSSNGVHTWHALSSGLTKALQASWLEWVFAQNSWIRSLKRGLQYITFDNDSS